MHFLEDFGKRHGKTTGPGSSETFGPFGPPYGHVFSIGMLQFVFLTKNLPVNFLTKITFGYF